MNSFSIVSSLMNQRIEAYLSSFIKDWLDWWKYFLQDLVDLELFDPSDPVQVGCLRFCFIELIREKVTKGATAWDQHVISHHRNGGPTGGPDIMFFLPHIYDTIDHSQYVSHEDIDGSHRTITWWFFWWFAEFAFYFIDQEDFEMSTSIRMFRSIPFFGW